MKPPEAPVHGQNGSASVLPPAVAVCTVLAKRRDFLLAAKARRQGMSGFLLQARHRREDESVDASLLRIGYTCSKKLGNAVTRNRAKRRLRAIARDVLPLHGRQGWDYVLVGRPEATVTCEYAQLRGDLVAALAKIHSGAT